MRARVRVDNRGWADMEQASHGLLRLGLGSKARYGAEVSMEHTIRTTRDSGDLLFFCLSLCSVFYSLLQNASLPILLLLLTHYSCLPSELEHPRIIHTRGIFILLLHLFCIFSACSFSNIFQLFLHCNLFPRSYAISELTGWSPWAKSYNFQVVLIMSLKLFCFSDPKKKSFHSHLKGLLG